MKIWKSTMAVLLCAFMISGCGTVSGGTARSDEGESALVDSGGSTQPDIAELAQSDEFRPMEDGTVFLSLYTDEEFGLELQYSPDAEGEYRIVCEEQETFWELAAAPEDIRDIEIQSWGDEGLFLILAAELKDRMKDTFILNKEMMSEVMIQEPYAIAESCFEYTVVEEKNLILLGEGGFQIECEDNEALTVLEKNLWISDDIRYGVEEGSFTCYVPVFVGPDDEIGTICLYYEYDGVGMNCIDTRFVPAKQN